MAELKLEENVFLTKIQKGTARIIIELKDISWDELVEMVKFYQKNPRGNVVEVHVGNGVWDA